MSVKQELIQEKLPKHVAIIMDGNGRWAKKQGKMRVFGHKHGVNSVRQVVEASGEMGIKYLTLYAFSTENWNRPKLEVDTLMALLVASIKAETKKLHKNNVRLLTIGNTAGLPKSVQKKLDEAIAITANNTGLNLVLALNYSAKWEINEAVKSIAQRVERKELNIEDIDNELISNSLTTKEIPDPELLIRTSGEYRISNFLLWQIAYSELYFTDKLWPDFGKEDFFEALHDYQNRERRFGKISEQIQ